jgi:hypothetical protein
METNELLKRNLDNLSFVPFEKQSKELMGI